MTALYQKCFVIVSDIASDPGVLIHNVVISEFDAGRELARQIDLPSHLRVNLRSLPATLTFRTQAGGAMPSQWQQVTDKILDERHELWQQMADSDDGEMEAQLPNTLLDLIRFMCNVWHKTNDWAINKVGTDILMSYPMVQGTANQMALRKIAMQPYNTENIREAVDWMIAQVAIDRGAMGEGE